MGYRSGYDTGPGLTGPGSREGSPDGPPPPLFSLERGPLDPVPPLGTYLQGPYRGSLSWGSWEPSPKTPSGPLSRRRHVDDPGSVGWTVVWRQEGTRVRTGWVRESRASGIHPSGLGWGRSHGRPQRGALVGSCLDGLGSGRRSHPVSPEVSWGGVWVPDRPRVVGSSTLGPSTVGHGSCPTWCTPL